MSTRPGASASTARCLISLSGAFMEMDLQSMLESREEADITSVRLLARGVSLLRSEHVQTVFETFGGRIDPVQVHVFKLRVSGLGFPWNNFEVLRWLVDRDVSLSSILREAVRQPVAGVDCRLWSEDLLICNDLKQEFLSPGTPDFAKYSRFVLYLAEKYSVPPRCSAKFLYWTMCDLFRDVPGFRRDGVGDPSHPSFWSHMRQAMFLNQPRWNDIDAAWPAHMRPVIPGYHSLALMMGNVDMSQEDMKMLADGGVHADGQSSQNASNAIGSVSNIPSGGGRRIDAFNKSSSDVSNRSFSGISNRSFSNVSNRSFSGVSNRSFSNMKSATLSSSHEGIAENRVARSDSGNPNLKYVAAAGVVALLSVGAGGYMYGVTKAPRRKKPGRAV